MECLSNNHKMKCLVENRNCTEQRERGRGERGRAILKELKYLLMVHIHTGNIDGFAYHYFLPL